ncbi:MAG TPA: cytidine deaminase [Alphaproteobacteria bacterium]|nr:cytidine deaminase [Alphaproteobacteria bacterium]
MIAKELQDKLLKLAKEAQENAYTPYSKFPIGTALLTEDGDIYTGCNIENISYPLTNCSERTAIFKMVSEKGPKGKIKAIVVTTKADIPCSPCGACRQVIQEFSTPDTVVIYKGPSGFVNVTIGELLPGAFTEFVAVDQDGSSRRIQTGM